MPVNFQASTSTSACSEGYTAITDASTCSDGAAQLGKNYEYSGSWSWFWKGCGYRGDDGRTFFNTHRSGGKNRRRSNKAGGVICMQTQSTPTTTPTASPTLSPTPSP